MGVLKIRNAADTGWIELGGTETVYQSATEPTSPHAGQLWLDTDAETYGGWTYTSPVSMSGSPVTLVTGLPVGLVDIELILNNVSTNTDNNHFRVQLGYGAGPTYVTTNYDCHGGVTGSGMVGEAGSLVAGFPFGPAAYLDAAQYFFGVGKLVRSHPTEDLWIWKYRGVENYTYMYFGVGQRDIGNEITAIRMMCNAGVFDSGYVSVRYR